MIEEPVKRSVKRERFLALLKKRYGYSNDEAVDEMERLLTLFYNTNKSFIVHPTHHFDTLAVDHHDDIQ